MTSEKQHNFGHINGIANHNLIEKFDHWISQWHSKDKQLSKNFPTSIFGLAQQVLYYNYALWHEEDQARRKDVSDSVIAKVKRNIDRFNQKRNDTIEMIDLFLSDLFDDLGITPAADAGMNSETPGSIIDRLSILSLKIYHMHEETLRTDVKPDHIEKAVRREAILRQQREDLGQCLDILLQELVNGHKILKLYHQFKMYNDPSTNPALYGSRKPI